MSDSGDRNHAPTAIRLQQARAAGDIPKSAELAASLSMLGAIGAAYLTFSNISTWLLKSTTQSWSVNRIAEYSPESMVSHLQGLLFDLAWVLLPFMTAIVLVTIAAHWFQTGPVWLPSKAVPDSANLGWGKWKQKFGMLHLLGIGGLGLPKIMIGLAVMMFGIWFQRDALFSLGNMPPQILVAQLFSTVALVCLQVAGTLVILGLFDFGLKWTANQRRMRMTEREIREELRSQGGSSVNRLRKYGADAK